MWTIPNAVSFVRLLSIPLFLWVLFGKDDPALAGWLLLAIGATDWIDGYLARRLNQVSEVGKVLDPLADRLAVVTAVAGGWIADVIPPVLAGALVAREALVAIGALLLLVKGLGKLDVRYLGKLSTLLLYGAISAFFIAAGDVAHQFMIALAWMAGIAGTVLYYWVAGLYLGDIRKKLVGGS